MGRYTICLAAALIMAGFAPTPVLAGDTPAPPDAQVYVIWPKDGRVVHGGRFWLRMGAKNIGIAPAGTKKPNTGHHHVIIDTELPPGRHTIQLLMADHEHIPHDPPLYSERIIVIVPPATAGTGPAPGTDQSADASATER